VLPRNLSRLSGFDYRGMRHYSLTLVTESRRAVFVDAPLVRACQSHALEAAAKTAFSIDVACYMPDHLHLIVAGTSPGSDLCAFVKLAKQLTGYYVKQRFGVILWQDGFHDRIVRKHEDLAKYIEYVRNNPVTAGLARIPEDYPFLFMREPSSK
jgi:putative transposase